MNCGVYWWHTMDTLLSKSFTPLSLHNFFDRSCGVVLHSTPTPLPLYSHSTLTPQLEWEWSESGVTGHSTTSFKKVVESEWE